jgi:hypothetical protein
MDPSSEQQWAIEQGEDDPLDAVTVYWLMDAVMSEDDANDPGLATYEQYKK